MKGVLIVESPTKVKTIANYLNKSRAGNYSIVSTYGHVRSLPSKSGAIEVDNGFTCHYEISPEARGRVKSVLSTINKNDTVYLATDPDREGEAIAWHIQQIIQENLGNNIKIHRIVFNEITAKAIIEALEDKRDVDINLVQAQQARQGLDYLVGFGISPVLWTKLPGSKSAGRVQSATLRLIADREDEIDQFISQEYWSISGYFDLAEKIREFHLVKYQGKDLEKLDISNQEQAEQIVNTITQDPIYLVQKTEKKEVKRQPPPPYITSTLQQDAFNKLGFSAKHTMSLAQKLYEGIKVKGEYIGLITYMRTDGLHTSEEALKSIRALIKKDFGAEYLPKSAHKYSSKAKNAQEAHEAIRPADINLTPEEIASSLTPEQLKLYSLIWRRQVASQMTPAITKRLTIEIGNSVATFRTTLSKIEFEGYLKLYQSEENEGGDILIDVQEKDEAKLKELKPDQHFTQAPPRYSEASLIKKMEELMIGRPSTYAKIISVIQERGYVELKSKHFIPGTRGRVVSAFLKKFFSLYVDYSFTAELEEQLDKIANGEMKYIQVLSGFWQPFNENVNKVKKLKIDETNQSLEPLVKNFISDDINNPCPKCESGQLKFNIGKFGPFLGCSNYPDCNYIRPTDSEEEYPKSIGGSGSEEIFLNRGPFGYYLQCGGKRVSVNTQHFPIEQMDLETAKKLISLPLVIGEYQGSEVRVSIGPFGPYIAHDGKFFSLKNINRLFSLTLPEAIEIMSSSPNKSLGKTDKGEDIRVCRSRYGIYLKVGKKNVAIPKGTETASISLEQAKEIIKNSAQK